MRAEGSLGIFSNNGGPSCPRAMSSSFFAVASTSVSLITASTSGALCKSKVSLRNWGPDLEGIEDVMVQSYHPSFRR